MRILPEDVEPLPPVAMLKAPPVPAEATVDCPATNIISPPVKVFPTPIERITSPPLPNVAAPVEMLTSPDVPELVVPVEKNISPEIPNVPALDGRTTIWPLDKDLPAPVVTLTDPPV